MKVYVASKIKHAETWRLLRAAGLPIVASWIDEPTNPMFDDLWTRCVQEASTCDVLLVYREDGEQLKGALVEIGAALGKGVRVFVVGPTGDDGTWRAHPSVLCFDALEPALLAIGDLKETA